MPVSIGTQQHYPYRRAFLFALLNMPVSLLITAPLFLRAAHDAQPWFVSNLLMFASTAVILNFAVLIPVTFLTLIRTPRILLAIIAGLLATALQLILLVDVRVFAIFKFHINGLILNFLTTEGAGDSLSLGAKTWFTFAAWCAGIIVWEIYLAHRNLYRPDSFQTLRRHAVPVFVCLLAVVVLDKIIYAGADLTNKITVLTASRYYPCYQKVTIKHVAAKWFGFKNDREKNLNLSNTGRTLNYPLQPLTFATNAPRPNIVVLFADGFRADMLTPEITPHLCEFAKNNITLQNHFSGGNGTRFGTFSFFYGLYGNLWHPFLEARQGPVFFDVLQDMKYEFLVLSSTRLTFPEFRKTVFIKIPNAIQDEHSAPESYKRDAVMVEQFRQFIEHRDTKRPFFAFAFFNSSHPFYQYPPEFEKYKPVVTESINYMGSISADTAAKLKNRYRNSLLYTDSLFHKVITELQARNLLDNTIVVITGDHGEEFNENGYYSHNSAFDDYQAKSTLVMKFPGKSAQTITNLTSHLDIIPTILNQIGCATPPAAYSHGRDIFNDPPRHYTFCSDWDYGAIVTLDERVILPITGGKTGFIELRTAQDYRLIEDRNRLTPHRAEMMEVAKDLGKFLK